MTRGDSRCRIVRFDEVGADGCLPPSGYVRYAQDVAWQHSDARGFDRTWYDARRVQWLVRWVEVELVSPARFGSTVAVSTRVIGGRRALARRRTEVRAESGELHAVVLTDWILLGESGRPARVPAESVRCSRTARHSRRDASPSANNRRTRPSLELRVRPQDLDPMRHVNNARYLDFVDEVLGGPDPGARRYTLEFLRPAAPDEILTASAWRAGVAWSVSIAGAPADQVLRAMVEI